MPELPEVETVRRGLVPVMEGRVIAQALVRRSDLRWPLPAGMADRLAGARIENLRRRSKYLLAELSTGETLIVHLGMSGRILVARPGAAADSSLAPEATAEAGDRTARMLAGFHHQHPAPAAHDHVILDMELGVRVVFNDARRFGAMDLVATTEVEAHWLLAPLGPEPLGNGFGEEYLVERLRGRATPIKAALLDQRLVAGLGNIYVCEALHRAGIAPRRQAGRVSAARLRHLVPIIRQVLTEAIAAGGASLRDHRRPDGELGYFQLNFDVYGREGLPCLKPECGGIVARSRQAGRSSFHCPRCQR